MTEQDILAKSTNAQVSYWLGVVLMGIGSGDVRSSIHQIISFYQREAYERGLRDAKKR